MSIYESFSESDRKDDIPLWESNPARSVIFGMCVGEQSHQAIADAIYVPFDRRLFVKLKNDHELYFETIVAFFVDMSS